MRVRKTVITVALVLCLFCSMLCGISAGAAVVSDVYPVKNVILMIGSGMTTNHITAAAVKKGVQLTLGSDVFGSSGTLATLSGNNSVTDSAAAATALATGFKVDNYAVGVDSSGTQLVNLSEAAKESGRKVGIITTKCLNDATPAAFSSHVEIKSDLNEIAKQQIDSGIDLFLGGGSYYYDRFSSELKAAGYKYVKSPGSLRAVTQKSGKIFGTFSNFNFGKSTAVPALKDMLEKSFELLDNDNGFFIMAEGGQTDFYSNSHDMTAMANEMVAFDAAVASAISYVDANPDTLLIVTADHETGGLVLPSVPSAMNVVNTCFKSYGNTAADVPYFTYGKNAKAISGRQDNTAVAKLIASVLELDGIGGKPAIPAEKDYEINALKSFSGWRFTNVKKTSSVAGVTVEHSSSASAVSVSCTGTRLSFTFNARVAFSATFRQPLPSMFIAADDSSSTGDLSACDGIGIVFVGDFDGQEYKVTVGREAGNNPFTSEITISDADINSDGSVLLPFDDFTPAITPEMAVGMDLFAFSSEGAAKKTTLIIKEINAYTEDDGLNYYEAIALAGTIDENEYTESTYAAFKEKYDAALIAADREERYNTKKQLLAAIDNLEERVILSNDLGITQGINLSGITTAGAEPYILSDGEKDVIALFSAGTDASVTLTDPPSFNIPAGNDGIRVALSSNNPERSDAPGFAVTLRIVADGVEHSCTVNRPISDRTYCYFGFDSFDIPFTDSAVNADSITLSFAGIEYPVQLNIHGFEAYIYAQTVLSPRGDMDGNGIIDDADILCVMRVASRTARLSAEQAMLADVDMNGIVDAADALSLQRSAD